MFSNLIARFWSDESGAVIATEYLMLGSVVALGSASGMVAMRDSVIDEYKELGQGVREIRQASSVPPATRGAGNRAGAATATHPTFEHPNAPTAQEVHAACPTP